MKDWEVFLVFVISCMVVVLGFEKFIFYQTITVGVTHKISYVTCNLNCVSHYDVYTEHEVFNTNAEVYHNIWVGKEHTLEVSGLWDRYINEIAEGGYSGDNNKEK